MIIIKENFEIPLKKKERYDVPEHLQGYNNSNKAAQAMAYKFMLCPQQ